MRRWTTRTVRRLATAFGTLVVFVVTVVVVVILVRAFDARGLPPLRVWHTIELSTEFRATDAAGVDSLAEYLALEDAVFDEIRSRVMAAVPDDPANRLNRYAPESAASPMRFERDWNRTTELVPGTVRGGALLLHGLSDSPYSMRTIGGVLRDQGYYVLCVRLPGHGTIPGDLARVHWRDWRAVVDLAARHVRERIGPDAPFVIGGYSNGGTLAVDYTVRAQSTDGPSAPDRVFLFSPAIAVTIFARFADMHRLVSWTDYFEQSRWQTIYPEYDPFKYNSFPMNAAKQCAAATVALERRLAALEASAGFDAMPPIITFQSVVDSTVDGDALIDRVYERMGRNDSELVLFDVNRNSAVQSLLRGDYRHTLDRLEAAATLPYRLTIVTNLDDRSIGVVARDRPPGAPDYVDAIPLGLTWPASAYSLSHIAIPFPPDDPLYGDLEPAPGVQPHVRITLLELHGERHMLKMPSENLLRIRHNPFFDYLQERLVAALPADRDPG